MAFSLRLPLAVSGAGPLESLAQGSPAEVGQSVQILLSTTMGERASLPDYGLISQIGQPEVSEDDVTDAVNEWEDRVDDVAVTVSGSSAEVALIVSGVPTTLALNILGGS